MDNFLFVIAFVNLSLVEHNDMDCAVKMMSGCLSDFNIVDLELPAAVQALIADLKYDTADQVISDINNIKDVYLADRAAAALKNYF